MPRLKIPGSYTLSEIEIDKLIKESPKKKKKSDFNARTKKFLEGLGYSVARVDKWNSFSQKHIDYLGLFDMRADSKDRKIYIQICAESGVSAHRTKMHSEERAPDNKKPRIVNLINTLEQGYQVAIIAWKKDEKGKWVNRVINITKQTVEDYLHKHGRHH